MSPPEIWGPAIWSFFHTLASQIKEPIYPILCVSLFHHIKQICSALPCPECSNDASRYLSKINISELKTKNEFIRIIYVFHNYVNKKKQKPLFPYTYLNIYNKSNILNSFQRFLSHYHTKGNMKQLTESFQRQLIVREIKKWLLYNITAFFTPIITPPLSRPLIKQTVLANTENTENTVTKEQGISNPLNISD